MELMHLRETGTREIVRSRPRFQMKWQGKECEWGERNGSSERFRGGESELQPGFIVAMREWCKPTDGDDSWKRRW